jgi:hypothetical protein
VYCLYKRGGNPGLPTPVKGGPLCPEPHV